MRGKGLLKQKAAWFPRRCLVIKENMSKNNYCMECAALILQKAKEELDGLAHELAKKNDVSHIVIKSGQEL